MRLSAFTPTGILRLTSEPSPAQSIYNSLANQYRDSGISIEKGSRVDCTIFAEAMGMARAQRCLEKAWNQILPTKVTDLLDQREAEYGVVPSPTQNTDQRRGVLASRKLLPGGASRNNVENALAALLGSDFIHYRPTKNAEVVNTPAAATDQPINFQLPGTAPKVISLAFDVCLGLGSPQEARYLNAPIPMHPAIPATANYIGVGDVLVIDAGSVSAERVTVTGIGTSRTFIATFNQPHQAGAICTTQPWPAWSSNRRSSLIVVTASAAVDPVKRKAVDDLMGRIARGVSSWAIVASTSTGFAGPFVIDTSPLGATPFGSIIYP